MPKITYVNHRFSQAAQSVISTAIAILEEYVVQGFDLTLRQLYYQFVARGLIPNQQSEYKKLGKIINDARLAGLIDWNHIVDRTRNLVANGHWDSPQELIESCSTQFMYDKWLDQPYHVEVWIEKDALIGVALGICRELDIGAFSCRGYTSQSEMWRAGRRLGYHQRGHRRALILHLGDHDPSGMDMTRDVWERLSMFADGDIGVKRLALNMDQVEQFNPPPNPAKLSDTRATRYIEEFGDESWELDALEPAVLTDLIRNAVLEVRDETLWAAQSAREQDAKEQLRWVAEHWDELGHDDT